MSLDSPLTEVATFLCSKLDLAEIAGNALRQSFDEVIDGPRTGRYCIEQLEKTEKTYIGTKVEIVLRAELNLDRGLVLDNLICGHEVDTKFSLTGAWMIPKEAVGRLCLLVAGNDNIGTFRVGLLRTSTEVLTNGANQDGKKSVSAAGKLKIYWLIENAGLPENFLLKIDNATRTLILSQRSGRERLKTLFREVTGVIIPRTAILQVAQLAGDPLRRAREAKDALKNDGLKVLCAAYEKDKIEFRRHGFNDFSDDAWLSIQQ